jgi:hypothetical protein
LQRICAPRFEQFDRHLREHRLLRATAFPSSNRRNWLQADSSPAQGGVSVVPENFGFEFALSTLSVVWFGTMSVLELSDEQVISLVRQLPAERKRTALLALAQDSQGRREERLRFGEAQLRQACAERGLNWDRLSEDEREAFVNDLLHEK